MTTVTNNSVSIPSSASSDDGVTLWNRRGLIDLLRDFLADRYDDVKRQDDVFRELIRDLRDIMLHTMSMYGDLLIRELQHGPRFAARTVRRELTRDMRTAVAEVREQARFSMELNDIVQSAKTDLDPDEAFALWRALDRQAVAYDNSLEDYSPFTCHMTADEIWAFDRESPAGRTQELPELECSAVGGINDEDVEWSWRAHKSGWVVHGDPVPDYACTCERFFAAHEEHGVVFGFGPEPEYLLYASSQEALEAFLEQDFIFWYDPQDM